MGTRILYQIDVLPQILFFIISCLSDNASSSDDKWLDAFVSSDSPEQRVSRYEKEYLEKDRTPDIALALENQLGFEQLVALVSSLIQSKDNDNARRILETNKHLSKEDPLRDFLLASWLIHAAIRAENFEMATKIRNMYPHSAALMHLDCEYFFVHGRYPNPENRPTHFGRD